MTSSSTHERPKGAAVGFAEARVAAEVAEGVAQHHAARRVAEHSHNADDCRELLSMLGLSGVAPRVVQEQRPNLTFPDALGVFRSTEGVRR